MRAWMWVEDEENSERWKLPLKLVKLHSDGSYEFEEGKELEEKDGNR